MQKDQIAKIMERAQQLKQKLSSAENSSATDLAKLELQQNTQQQPQQTQLSSTPFVMMPQANNVATTNFIDIKLPAQYQKIMDNQVQNNYSCYIYVTEYILACNVALMFDSQPLDFKLSLNTPSQHIITLFSNKVQLDTNNFNTQQVSLNFQIQNSETQELLLNQTQLIYNQNDINSYLNTKRTLHSLQMLNTKIIQLQLQKDNISFLIGFVKIQLVTGLINYNNILKVQLFSNINQIQNQQSQNLTDQFTQTEKQQEKPKYQKIAKVLIKLNIHNVVFKKSNKLQQGDKLYVMLTLQPHEEIQKIIGKQLKDKYLDEQQSKPIINTQQKKQFLGYNSVQLQFDEQICQKYHSLQNIDGYAYISYQIIKWTGQDVERMYSQSNQNHNQINLPPEYEAVCNQVSAIQQQQRVESANNQMYLNQFQQTSGQHSLLNNHQNTNQNKNAIILKVDDAFNRGIDEIMNNIRQINEVVQ